MKQPEVTFRPLAPADLPLLHEWLNRPHVAEWWEGPQSFESVVSSYGAEIGSSTTQQMLAHLEGRAIGFVQSYIVVGADSAWWPGETDPGARGIDQFLAEASQLGQGLGSRMVRHFVSYLFGDPRVTKIQTDPSPDNTRAIRAYEKVGFQRITELVTPDGPALLMVISRAEWLADPER